jgi:hypothetical protein
MERDYLVGEARECASHQTNKRKWQDRQDGHGTHGMGRQWTGQASAGEHWPGTERQDWKAWVWTGEHGRVLARNGTAGGSRRGADWLGRARSDKARTASERPGMERQEWPAMAGNGMARPGTGWLAPAWLGRHRSGRSGMARQAMARGGAVGRAQHWNGRSGRQPEWHGVACIGLARSGSAGIGAAGAARALASTGTAGVARMSDNDNNNDWIDDEDLLIEAARYAVKIDCNRNRFMTLAKRAWFQAATEAGRDPQTVGIKLRPPRDHRQTRQA